MNFHPQTKGSFATLSDRQSLKSGKSISTQPAACKTARRQKWTEEEDEVLKRLVAVYRARDAEPDWAEIANNMTAKGLRKTEKQARDHFNYQLREDLKSGAMDDAEKLRLFQEQKQTDRNWKRLVCAFPGRTDNTLKNQFFLLVRKALRKALRAANVNSDGSYIAKFKPGSLLKLLKEEKRIEDWEAFRAVESLEGRMGWIRDPVSVREFIEYFAFTRQEDITAAANEPTRRVISDVLSKINSINEEYCSKKQKPEPALNVDDLSRSFFAKVDSLQRARLYDSIDVEKLSEVIDAAQKYKEALQRVKPTSQPAFVAPFNHFLLDACNQGGSLPITHLYSGFLANPNRSWTQGSKSNLISNGKILANRYGMNEIFSMPSNNLT